MLKILAQFFCSSLFQILRNSILTNPKKLNAVFCLFLFQILKKAYIQISKYPFHTNNNFKGNKLHKNHYTNNSHKNHYTNR